MIGDNPVADYEGGLRVGMTPVLVHNQVDGKVCCEALVMLKDVIRDYDNICGENFITPDDIYLLEK